MSKKSHEVICSDITVISGCLHTIKKVMSEHRCQSDNRAAQEDEWTSYSEEMCKHVIEIFRFSLRLFSELVFRFLFELIEPVDYSHPELRLL